MANVVDPSDLWELEMCLTESRKTVLKPEQAKRTVHLVSQYSQVDPSPT